MKVMKLLRWKKLSPYQNQLAMHSLKPFKMIHSHDGLKVPTVPTMDRNGYMKHAKIHLNFMLVTK